MSLKKFLIAIGFWVAFLPHIGFSILTENVLFSITGFVLIVASFYLAAIEDKHKYKRVVQGETLNEMTQKVNTLIRQVPYINKKQRSASPEKNTSSSNIKNMEINEKDTIPLVQEDSIPLHEEDQNRPRIKKAVSDVRLKTDSLDDIVS